MDRPLVIPRKSRVLPGREEPMSVESEHVVLGTRMVPPFPAETREAWFALGCFWGAERLFWEVPGVYVTAVGYAGGETPNPTYEEVCTGMTGHAETVRVIYRPDEVTYDRLLQLFWEAHDPTQGMRQGADVGTQYRSIVFCADDNQELTARQSRADYEQRLKQKGYGAITTDIQRARKFYYAESYHQQYLYKNPNGYCGLKGTGVVCPVGAAP